jgi:hypothetical protein
MISLNKCVMLYVKVHLWESNFQTEIWKFEYIYVYTDEQNERQIIKILLREVQRAASGRPRGKYKGIQNY